LQIEKVDDYKKELWFSKAHEVPLPTQFTSAASGHTPTKTNANKYTKKLISIIFWFT
jgi:hypothetical protein